MVAPRRKHLNILGLGFSVGTNGAVLTSDVVVVKSFDELKNRSNEVKGKIVVYNFDYDTYGRKAVYRKYGATFAAKYGATAVLVIVKNCLDQINKLNKHFLRSDH